MSFTRFDPQPLLSRVEIARRVHKVSLARGLDELATVIALMTISTEVGAGDGTARHWWCPANRKDAASLNFPHDSESDDSRSVGYYQQQNSAVGVDDWWGTMRSRMTLELATDVFLDRLADDYGRAAGNPKLAGQFAQRVQGSAFPDRYAQRWDEAWAVLREALRTEPAPTPTPEPTTPEVPVGKPAYREIDRMGNSRSPRRGARVRNFLLHTQEGDGTAESLAAYLNNSANQVSYHYTLRGGVVVDVVDTDYASWSVLDANPYTVNLCFAGSRAGWSRAQWLAIGDDIRVAAWLAVEDGRKYGFAADVLAPPYRVADGFSDHKYVTQALGIGNHTDVGPNFPWDVFAAAVREFTTTTTAPPKPVVNMIDQYAAAHADLVGERIDKGELATPDGRGRFAGFANGWVYWTPETGAVFVPRRMMEAWAVYKWETGPLGYPTVGATQLADGWVQAFEKGVLYWRDGAAIPFYVTGMIGARWARDGYERGSLGWPISNETIRGDGSVRQDFEHGSILWAPDGTVVLANDDGATHVRTVEH
ncbi:endolysin [Tsukamurella phage TPA2]|uniref:endolysin n=1 Tax=Tsukamurella phage TPA2 TaxID=981330 RepID=UPI0001FF8DCE|nr:endolysin [Tsukamurella phage TPA2]ADX31969.1 lysin [Tsukamurella phage TPA2]